MRLAQIGIEPLRKSAQQLADALNVEIEKLIWDTQAAATTETELNAVSAADFNPSHMEATRGLAYTKFDLVRREVALRKRLENEWYPSRKTERQFELEAAEADFAKAVEDIQKRLLSIGFVNRPDGSHAFNDTEIYRHPELQAIGERRATASNRFHAIDDERFNREEIKRLDPELTALRTRLAKI